MYIIKFNNKIYKYESLWRNKKNIKITDYNGTLLPWPKSNVAWQMQKLFLNKLYSAETNLRRKNKFKKYSKDKYKHCLICKQKNITTGLYELHDIRWENGLYHYIKEHNIKPSDKFIDMIFRYQTNAKNIKTRKLAKIKGIKIIKQNKSYIKLDRNQILILDALMKHGSYKRYVDSKNKLFFRYSEHAGLLDFDNNGLERIIVSGNTTRVDVNDDDIFLPGDMIDMFDYEYIFHTHPATKGIAGGRAPYGILYEFPSIGDIFHFIDHYNEGDTQGSIVITSEGMYVIRKHKFDDKKIKINENKLYKDMYRTHKHVQKKAIKKYGTKFTPHEFYSNIAQNKTYIDILNNVLKKYQLFIDFYPRTLDKKNKWIIDTIYLPIYITEPSK
uniref:Uncharacterized protein n=1 Tax=Mimivirus LCMiAC02 TaxID=2506609 RepID=A0A481Z0K7_9VIRU|nr:MAG: uncharacterized protein LCMiAC02_00520 [Mimivirus LCMiAC02]